MMKMATALIQCMMRSGNGCRRCSLWAIDWTAAVDIEEDSTIVGLQPVQITMRRKTRERRSPHCSRGLSTVRLREVMRKHSAFTNSRGAFDWESADDVRKQNADCRAGFIACSSHQRAGADLDTSR